MTTGTDAENTRPKRITNADELSQAITDKAWRDRIARQVDFSREHVLYFVWSGVVTDQLSHKVEKSEKGQTVVFTYTPGGSDDPSRGRFRLFVIGKGATFRVETGKIGTPPIR